MAKLMGKARPKVHIVYSDFQYEGMFGKWNWDITDNIADADLIQFTGGSDVTPSLYGHTRHNTTHYDYNRDLRESLIFNIARERNIPMAGICRGAQFLNVMCGGKMWQNVQGHTCGIHKALDVRTGEEITVTSTHHQMMIPGPKARLIMGARSIAIYKVRMNPPGVSPEMVAEHYSNDMDIEALYYADEKCFCFQPHPEFPSAAKFQLDEYYMERLAEFFGIQVA